MPQGTRSRAAEIVRFRAERIGYTTRFRFRHPDIVDGWIDLEAKSIEEAVKRCARITGIEERNLWLGARIELPDWKAVFPLHEGATLTAPARHATSP